jgi:HD-GYP domain-containing protein (c-di-GMP phosphodiesterase class II)
MPKRLRTLIVGGDASLWIALSSELPGSSQIVVPNDIDAFTLKTTAKEIDVVIVVTEHSSPDPLAQVRTVREAHLERRTIVIAAGSDQRTAAESLGLGIAGYVVRGTSARHIARAIEQVAGGGAFYDAPAAAVLQRSEDTRSTGTMMSSARALASALEFKDTYTGGHAERVTSLAIRLARAALHKDALPSEALEAAFLLHDVGKIGIPESILNKPDSLTDTERRVLNTHPILGERIVAPLGFPEVVRHVIRHHHERWDGTGYPDGIAGENIPAAARIFQIADSIDAMTSIRPYRLPVTFQKAVEDIMANAGTQFDPSLCLLMRDVFLKAGEPIRLETGAS